jgi:hypothetical protein
MTASKLGGLCAVLFFFIILFNLSLHCRSLECSAVNHVFTCCDRRSLVGDQEPSNSATSSGRLGGPSGIPPSELIKLCLALAVSVPASAASRSINASAALASVNPGVTLLTRIPRGPTFYDRPLL